MIEMFFLDFHVLGSNLTNFFGFGSLFIGETLLFFVY